MVEHDHTQYVDGCFRCDLRDDELSINRIASWSDMADDDPLREPHRLLEYALHLCVNGENAPGGDETWAKFGEDCEAYLRRDESD